MPKKKVKIALAHEILAGAGLFLILIVGALFVYSQVWAETVSITARVLPPDVSALIDSVRPQGRVGSDQTNSDTTFYLTVRTADDSDDTILFTQPALVTANNDGTYSTAIELTGIAPGTYDIGLKGSQHLTRVLNNVTLVAGNNTLNFTQPDNSAGRGAQVLLTGDVNGGGTDPASLGDDVVNAVDISALLNVIDDDDLTGNNLRPNLNQDPVVNAVDLSWMISNLDVEGDK